MCYFYLIQISGNLNNISGVVIPADLGVADLQIFTREGVQLSGKPLTEQQVDELISKTNGFAEDAVYTAKYTAIGADNQYIGAEIKRLTTAGAQTKTITAIGFSDNLNLLNDQSDLRYAIQSNFS